MLNEHKNWGGGIVTVIVERLFDYDDICQIYSAKLHAPCSTRELNSNFDTSN